MLDLDSLIYAREINQDKRLKKIKVYRHCSIGTDLSLHLHWDSEDLDPTGSVLSQHLVKLLKEIGLVNYSAWVEIGAREIKRTKVFD